MPVMLEPAWRWCCPHCGATNYAESVEAILTREEQREIAIAEGVIEDWQDLPDDESITAQTYPDTVTCSQCGRSEETERPDLNGEPGGELGEDL